MQFQHARESCGHSRDGREAIHHLEAETGLDALCDVHVFGNGTRRKPAAARVPKGVLDLWPVGRIAMAFDSTAWHTDAVTGDDGKLQVTLYGPATHVVN